jgi:cation diffusion facilitator family transporter
VQSPTGMTGWLVRRFASRHGGRSAQRRASYGLLGGYVSVVVNTLLFVVKLLLGLATGSIGIMADAVHTLSDSLTSAVVIASAYMARQPADKEHPFGHGRVEEIATIVIAVLLGVAAFEFGKTAVERIFNALPVEASVWTVVILAGTIAAKEWLARFAKALGEASGNLTLEADSWHHRSDALSTLIVIVGVVAGHFGWPIVDSIAGLLVALFLLWVAIGVARSAFHPLLGQAPSPEEVQAIKEKAMAVTGVRGVHDVVIHNYGDVRFVSLHVETSEAVSTARLHQIAHEVEKRVSSRHGSVCVHPDPVNDHHPAYTRVEEIVRGQVAEDRDLDSFHDLRIVGWGEAINVVLDLKPADDCEDADAAVERLEAALRESFPEANLVAEIEPRYSY